MSANGPIFVVGAPRSGTTLLQRMLRSHPQISSPTGESHFIIPLLADAARFGDLTQRDNLVRLLKYMHGRWSEFLDTDLHGIRFDVEATADAIRARGAATMPEVIDTLFRLNAEGEGKARWLDKTPYYIRHIPTLISTYPDAQFVHIVRDGRDAALSMLERAAEIRVFNFAACATLWKRYVDAGRSAHQILGADRYHELHYEDLLTAPNETVRKLCDYLGEEFSEKVIDFQKSKDPNNRTPLLRQGLQKENRDKWRSAMTARQIDTFEAIAGDTLEACGYTLARPRQTLGLFGKLTNDLHQRAMLRLNPHPRDPRFKKRTQG